MPSENRFRIIHIHVCVLCNDIQREKCIQVLLFILLAIVENGILIFLILHFYLCTKTVFLFNLQPFLHPFFFSCICLEKFLNREVRRTKIKADIHIFWSFDSFMLCFLQQSLIFCFLFFFSYPLNRRFGVCCFFFTIAIMFYARFFFRKWIFI